MKRVRLTAAARADLREIWKYTARRGDSFSADHVLQKLLDSFELLARSPRIGRVRKDVTPECRSFPVGVYVAYYLAETNRIEIVRVLHGKQDQAAAFRQTSENPGGRE